jgi:hypothetical protein
MVDQRVFTLTEASEYTGLTQDQLGLDHDG